MSKKQKLVRRKLKLILCREVGGGGEERLDGEILLEEKTLLERKLIFRGEAYYQRDICVQDAKGLFELFSGRRPYRCFVDNCLKLLQVLTCVDVILVGEVINLNHECSGQI